MKAGDRGPTEFKECCHFFADDKIQVQSKVMKYGMLKSKSSLCFELLSLTIK